jgi:tetratricopeptide (TPR) repeat protein
VAALTRHELHRQVATTRASWAAARVIGNDVGPDTLALFEESLAAIREHGMVRFEAGVRANYATALFGVGRLDEGKEHLEEALITLSAMGARRRRATVLYNLACLEGSLGDDDACERHTLEARAIFEEFGHGQFLVMSAINLAVVRLKRDAFSEALAWLDRGEQDLQASGDLHVGMILVCYRAIARALCGMVSDARADALRADELRVERGVEDNGLVGMAAAFTALAEAGLADDPAPSLAVVDRYLAAPGWGSGVRTLGPLLRRLRDEHGP